MRTLSLYYGIIGTPEPWAKALSADSYNTAGTGPDPAMTDSHKFEIMTLRMPGGVARAANT